MTGAGPQCERPPDIVVVLADDMGYSDLGWFGGDIRTPRLDALARAGTVFTQFYSSPRCSPSRASLLTGLHPHQAGIGILTGDERPEGYPGDLSEASHTIAELLRAAGYHTCLAGKWHLSSDLTTPSSSWPNARGFDRAYGTIEGAGSYYAPFSLHQDGADASGQTRDPGFYYTDAIAGAAVGFVQDHAAADPDRPMFLYLAFTAPHWPLHARPAEIGEYRGAFDDGWDVLRERRHAHLVDQGLVEPHQAPNPRDTAVPPWEDTPDKGWQARRMEVYAAQVTAMDRAVGRVLDALEDAGRADNTLVLFLSDNGGCEEEVPPARLDDFLRLAMVPTATRDGRPLRLDRGPSVDPGPEDTFASYGREWANLSNAPFREYKHWVHEGGIATPLIVHWPQGLGARAAVVTSPAQLTDLLPTIVDIAAAEYPEWRDGHRVLPPEGTSLLPLLRGDEFEHGPLFWEHEGNAAVRRGRFKLVRVFGGPWQLYDIDADRAEQHDLAAQHPGLVADLAAEYDAWAARVGVIPRERIVARYRRLAAAGRRDGAARD